MRKLKVLWRTARTPRVLEELESWSSVLLAIGAALLLYATLKAQAAHAEEFPGDFGAPTLLSAPDTDEALRRQRIARRTAGRAEQVASWGSAS